MFYAWMDDLDYVIDNYFITSGLETQEILNRIRLLLQSSLVSFNNISSLNLCSSHKPDAALHTKKTLKIESDIRKASKAERGKSNSNKKE